MCRGFDHGGRRNGEALKIKAFYVRLLSSTHDSSSSSDSLTLHFPRRINGAPLDVDGFSVRPDTPAFLTLHRLLVSSKKKAVYGSRERLRVSEGARFEVYAGDVKVLKGIVRKDEEETWKWRLDCKSQAEAGGELHLSEADVWVEVEGLATEAEVMTEKVEMGGEKRRSRVRGFREYYSLEEIPEQREWESELDGCCCCCGGDNVDGKAGGDGEGECDMEVDVEGVRWAVDVGIWVACLGVGYLVSIASRNRSITRLQRRLFQY